MRLNLFIISRSKDGLDRENRQNCRQLYRNFVKQAGGLSSTQLYSSMVLQSCGQNTGSGILKDAGLTILNIR